jgi:hypothetical protein
LAAAVAWLAYAAREWLILEGSPEADIRIDLIIIYPALAAITLWSLFRLVRKPGAH